MGRTNFLMVNANMFKEINRITFFSLYSFRTFLFVATGHRCWSRSDFLCFSTMNTSDVNNRSANVSIGPPPRTPPIAELYNLSEPPLCTRLERVSGLLLLCGCWYPVWYSLHFRSEKLREWWRRRHQRYPRQEIVGCRDEVWWRLRQKRASSARPIDVSCALLSLFLIYSI